MLRQTPHSRRSKVVLTAGFLALLWGTVTAFNDPATGYELSIYEATPLVYWFGLAVALTISLVVSFKHSNSGLLRDTGLLLGVLSLATLVSLPVIRGYYQFGAGDALTHLGWTRDIVAGRLDPFNLLYPGIHTMTIFVSGIVGAPLQRSQMYVVLAFVLVFVAFVTLCVRVLGNARWAVPVGLFSSLLLLPNNNVSVHVMAHPITQSLLFLPLILYLTLKYVARSDESAITLSVATPTGVLLTLSAVSLVFVHPQGALNVVGILAAVAGVQYFFRRFGENETIRGHRPVYVPTLVAGTAFVLWATRHERVHATIGGVLNGVLRGAAAADEIAQRSGSLEALGGDILWIFVLLFLVAAIFCVLAGVLVAVWAVGLIDDRHAERNALLGYVVVSLVPLTVAFLVFFASSMTTQHFRYVGFLMVPVTILGAVGIAEGAGYLTRSVSGQHVRVGLVVLFLLFLPLPLATLHSSPFIYQPTQGVSEMRMDGTEATVQYMDRDVAFAGIRSGPRRVLDGTYGTVGTEELGLRGTDETGSIPPTVFDSNLTSYYEDRRYVSITDADYQREVRLYQGFRYSERGFETLRTSPAVDRVSSNGAYRLYLLRDRSGSR